MIFHENRLLADDSHVISYLIFVEKLGKMSQNLSSAAVVIGVLRVKPFPARFEYILSFKKTNKLILTSWPLMKPSDQNDRWQVSH